MTKLTAELTIGQKVKLASLAAHIDEYLGETDPNARMSDEAAMNALLDDPDIRAILDEPENAALLPAKR